MEELWGQTEPADDLADDRPRCRGCVAWAHPQMHVIRALPECIEDSHHRAEDVLDCLATLRGEVPPLPLPRRRYPPLVIPHRR